MERGGTAAERLSVMRDYPPAVRVHGLECPDIPAHLLLSRLPMAEIAKDYPNGEPHLRCLSGGDRVGRIEVIEYPPHDYEVSSQHPPDAPRPLCAYCKGTHGILDVLTLPTSVARGTPGERDSAAR